MIDASSDPAPPQSPEQRPESSTKAILALTFSLVGLALCPLIGGIAGLIMGSAAKREIRASNGWKTGRGLAVAAQWIGGISVVLSVGAIVALFVMLRPISSGEDGVFESLSPQQCRSSQWYAESKSEVVRLIPGTTRIEQTGGCSESGGQYQVVFDSPTSPNAVDDVYLAAATEQGWQPTPADRGMVLFAHKYCLQKTIAGVNTFIQLANHDQKSHVYLIDVASAGAPAACWLPDESE